VNVQGATSVKVIASKPSKPSNPHYQRFGGDEAVRRLVGRFYELMSELPETQVIRAMHPDDLAPAKERLFMFLSGWLGGPPLYADAFGPPKLRGAHSPFAVDRPAVEAWMSCMGRALEAECADGELRGELLAAFRKIAEAVRNR